MEIPEGFFNTRYIFTSNGVLDEMSFAIGGQALPGRTAQEIADDCLAAITLSELVTSAGMNVSYQMRGTSTTLTQAGLPNVGESPTNIVGTNAGDGVIVNTCLLVRKNTGIGGRKNRGRCFVPAYAENNADIDSAGNVTGSHILAMQDLWSAFHTALVGLDVPPWLLHSNPVDAPTLITSFSVQSLAATQRRRMR